MPSTWSKLETSMTSTTTLSRAFVGVVCVAYGVKVAYPLLMGAGDGPNRQQPDAVNNNLTTEMLAKPPPTPIRSILRRHVNLTFALQFAKLVRVMIPRCLCPETGLLAGHTLCLFVRTILSVYVANLEGAIVRHIVRKEPRHFVHQLLKWFAVAVPATFINSMIRYLESRIALRFRSRLVHHSHRLYFTNQSYYRVAVLDGRLDNCAQRLTDDIEIVATTVSHLYGQITKPLFDILLMAIALANLTRRRRANIVLGPMLISGVVLLSALVLRLVSPRFGQLVAEEAAKKGYLRHVHSRLVANAEEVAFYGGQKVELAHLRSAYGVLVQHLEHMFGVRLWFVMLEQFLMKYVWSGTGLVVVALPILLHTPSISGTSITNADSISERTQYFTTAKNLLLTGSNAVERLMSSYKDVVELAGHTARVANMFHVLEEVSNGRYQKTAMLGRKIASPMGTVVYTTGGTEITLTDVPIVTPNGDVVCPKLSLSLRAGTHLLITGPNGCGKSSLFRILSGLWPIYGGELRTPKNAMFYIPQRPYMVIGNLRDQIIYPDTPADMINKQVRIEDLREVMRMAHLEHIVERDGFTTAKDWTDILSGGEKQRMAMARLFYHKPKYALLDECTSAVSIDVESSIYQLAIDLGITLLTITHRPTLWKFHTHILQFDGTGAWEFNELNVDDRNRCLVGEVVVDA